MNMDLKAKIDEIVSKIKNEKGLLEKFKADPLSTVESLIGIDLPDDQVENIVDAVKAKISLDDIGDKLSGITGKLGGLFGKK